MPYDYIEEYQKQDDETIWLFRDKDAQEKIDTSLTETDYANPLSLTTDNAQNAVDTKIKIEPIQDLHGYDKPWVGGAGKNVLKMTVDNIKVANTGGIWNGNEYAINNVTITLLTDIDNNIIGIKVNGTASSNVNFVLSVYDKYLANGNYKLNGCPAGGSTSGTTYYLGFYIQGKSVYNFGSRDTNISIDGTEATGANVFIHAHANYNCQNLIFYPMIRLATESDATFEPYTNISSISGHDQINVLGYGKNLLGCMEVVSGTTATSEFNGDEIKVISASNGTYKASNFDWDILPSQWGKRIYVSCASATSSGSNDWRVNLRTSSDGINYTEKINITGTLETKTMLIPENTVKMKLLLYSTSAVSGSTGDYVIYKKLQLEYNEDGATEYELPQESNNLSIDLPSTVYGGVLDLESGELVVDYGFITVNKPLSTGTYYALNPAPKYTRGTAASHTISNKLTYGYNTIDVPHYYFENDNKVYLPGTSWEVDDAQICYEIATPFTIYISPEHLKLLKAQNTITTSQYTQVKVTYRNGIFATLEELSDTANGIYDEISGDATTVSGNPINFTTREKQKSKSTVVDLEPIQDLHGFTKPWIGGAGKNKYRMRNTDYSNVGINLTTNSDGTVNFSGTATGGNFMVSLYSNTTEITQLFTEGGTFSLSFNKGTYNSNTLNISMAYKKPNDEGTYFLVPGTPAVIPANSVFTASNLYVANGNTVQSLNGFAVQLEKASSATSFEPYENICPISGRTSVDIEGCGKNLLPKSTLNGTIDGVTFTVDDNGSITANGIASALVIYNITLGYWKTFLKAGTYILSGITGGSNTTYDMRIMIDASQYPAELFNGDLVFTLDKDTQVSPRIIIRNGYKAENLKFYPMIRSASNTNGEFKPYQESNNLTISFGATVYGGRLDIEKGELVVDRGYAEFDGSNDEEWSLTGGTTNYHQFVTPITDAINSVNSICNEFQKITTSERGTKTGLVSYAPDNSHRFALTDNEILITSVENWKIYIANNPIQVCYELSTPQTIQLTPQQVQLLKGINNISTTGTTIAVTFKNGSVAHLDDLPENVFTDLDKEKLASIDTLAITLDLLTHTLVVTQDI